MAVKKIEKKVKLEYNSNRNGIDQQINNAKSNLEFYSKSNDSMAQEKKSYWQDYIAMLEGFKKNGYDIGTIPRIARFSDGGQRDAALFVQKLFNIDLDGADDFVTTVESKKQAVKNKIKEEFFATRATSFKSLRLFK